MKKLFNPVINLFKDKLTPKQRRELEELRISKQKEIDKINLGSSQHRPHPLCDCNQAYFNQRQFIDNQARYREMEIRMSDLRL